VVYVVWDLTFDFAEEFGDHFLQVIDFVDRGAWIRFLRRCGITVDGKGKRKADPDSLN
jgi:hypothetical protein